MCMKKQTLVRDATVMLLALFAAYAMVMLTQAVMGRIEGVAMLIFMLAVFVTSMYTEGYAWGVAASLISVLAVNFAFLSPYFAFNFTLSENLFSGLVMLVVSIMTSTLTTRIKKQEQLRMESEKEKMRANLLRAVSHDLRTPLTSISGNASILMGGPELLDEKKKQQLYTDIYDDAMWLISLVENLLTVTRIENGTMQLTLEPELIDEVAQEALRHLNRRSAEHTVTLAVPDDLLMAKMDPQLIVQVLINLTDNAIKYTPAGSSIAVSAQRSGETVRVEVADDGPGIPDAAKEKLFEMFYTAQAKRGDGRRGLGLGLSLCRSIVEAHGGQIGVRDNNPHGTVFWFTLPASDTPSAPPQNGPAVLQKCVFSDFA